MQLLSFNAATGRVAMMAQQPQRLTSPKLALAMVLVAACATPRVPAPPPATPAAMEGRELTADAQVHHVLNRLAFGAAPGDVAEVRAMGVDKWIAWQLEPERIPDPAVAGAMKRYPTLQLQARELVRSYPTPAIAAARDRRAGDTTTAEQRVAATRAREGYQRIAAELQSARVTRALVTERQLEEVMVDFWLNHFSVFIGKGPMRYYIGEFEREAIRPNALGNFRELLGDVARSPAMLFYLDNVQSVADSGQPTPAAGRRRGAVRGQRERMTPRPGQPPQARRRRGLNENYARELLELHTLGVDGGYTQADIVDVARAFTGWSIDDPRRGGTFIFRAAVHDAGAKSVLGTRLAPGRGIADGEQVLDLLARHPSTARFIASKLAIRFVSDSPPPALVERAATTFTRTGGDIRETVRTIVTSPEFFSRAAYRAKVKSPFEAVVSSLRALGAAPDTTARTAQLVGRLGQPLYGRQSPDGWPEKGDAWMNTGAILNRINFGMAVAEGRIPGVRLQRWSAYDSLRTAPTERQVDAVVALLLGGDVSTDTRAVLLSGEHPFIAAAAASDSIVGPARSRRPGLSGLAQIAGLALGSPEFQRR
jgi:uncharacterized protein (DUF1800 family)